MEKLNSNPQNLHNQEESKSLGVDKNQEVEKTKALRITERQTRSDSIWQNLDKTHGNKHLLL